MGDRQQTSIGQDGLPLLTVLERDQTGRTMESIAARGLAGRSRSVGRAHDLDVAVASLRQSFAESNMRRQKLGGAKKLQRTARHEEGNSLNLIGLCGELKLSGVR